MPRVTEQIKRRARSGTWSLGPKAQSTLWPAPPEGTQHEDIALAWDPERVRVSWEVIHTTEDPEERHREWARGTQRKGLRAPACINETGPLSFLWVLGFPYQLAVLPVVKQGQQGVPRELPRQEDTEAAGRGRRVPSTAAGERPRAWVQQEGRASGS